MEWYWNTTWNDDKTLKALKNMMHCVIIMEQINIPIHSYKDHQDNRVHRRYPEDSRRRPPPPPLENSYHDRRFHDADRPPSYRFHDDGFPGNQRRFNDGDRQPPRRYYDAQPMRHHDRFYDNHPPRRFNESDHPSMMHTPRQFHDNNHVSDNQVFSSAKKLQKDIKQQKKNKDKYNKNKPVRGTKIRNTETFEPMERPVDMRVVVDTGVKKSSIDKIATRDVVFASSAFSDFGKGELYAKLAQEVESCGEDILKLWHGNTHYIADDHTEWKTKAPTFKVVLDRIAEFFDMDIQATRLNWYKDTSQWKPFHHDAAAIKEDKARVQNFTVAVSFGATREAAFEHAQSKTVVSIPQPDGAIYAFAKDANVLWRHGILKDNQPRDEGRISVIAWGQIKNQ